MKFVGIIFIVCGLAVFIYILMTTLFKKPEIVSPIKQDNGVKIIYATPTP